MEKKKRKIVVFLMTLLLVVSFLPVMQSDAAQMYTENNGELSPGNPNPGGPTAPVELIWRVMRFREIRVISIAD